MNQFSARTLITMVWVCGFGAAASVDEPPASDQATRERMEKLFKMSVEELAHTEIVPLNVLGSHTHFQGEWMVGYNFMFMDMRGNLDGTRDVSVSEVLQKYPVAHTAMSMQMHMFELMYAPTERLTLMAMGQYKLNSMDHQTTNASFTARSEGFGDSSVMALYQLLGYGRRYGNQLFLNAGLSLPTGAIDAEDLGSLLEYSLQLGSGTFDLLPGLTYVGQTEDLVWGAQARGTIRLGENDHEYRLGNAYRINLWSSYRVTDWFGPSVRLDWQQWGNVAGADPALDPLKNPAFDANKQSGRRLDALIGLNFYADRGFLKGHRLSLEAGIPVYQYIAGPNLKADWMATISWSYVFR